MNCKVGEVWKGTHLDFVRKYTKKYCAWKACRLGYCALLAKVFFFVLYSQYLI